MRMLVVGMLFLAPALLLADETLGEVLQGSTLVWSRFTDLAG